MKSLSQILKSNGQSPNQIYLNGEFEFDKDAGCLVYQPSGMSNLKKTRKSKRAVKTTQ